MTDTHQAGPSKGAGQAAALADVVRLPVRRADPVASAFKARQAEARATGRALDPVEEIVRLMRESVPIRRPEPASLAPTGAADPLEALAGQLLALSSTLIGETGEAMRRSAPDAAAGVLNTLHDLARQVHRLAPTYRRADALSVATSASTSTATSTARTASKGGHA